MKNRHTFLSRAAAVLLCVALLSGSFLFGERGKADASSQSSPKIDGFSVTTSEGIIGLNIFLSGITATQVRQGKLVVDGEEHALSASAQSGIYTVTHYVDAKDIGRKLSISLYSAGRKVAFGNASAEDGVVSYSVKDYLSVIGERSDAMGRLARAIADYGTCASNYFYKKTEPVSIADVDFTPYRMVFDGFVPDSVFYNGSSLILTESIAIRHYFFFSRDIGDYTFRVDGTKVTPVQKGDLWYVEIAGITAGNIGKAYTLSITVDQATAQMGYSVLSYADLAAVTFAEEPLYKLVKSLYWYNKAFRECAASGQQEEQVTELDLVPITSTDFSGYRNSPYTTDMPTAVLVVPKNATPEETYAANLLQKYIAAEDGYTPAIVKDTEVSRGSRGFEISIGATNRPHGTAKYQSYDSYSIKSYSNGISLTGTGKLGLMHGAMRFLEECGGYYYLSWNDLYVTKQTKFKYEPNGVNIDYERAFVFTDMDICYSSLNPARDLTDPYYNKTKPSGYVYPRTGRLFSLAHSLNGFYADTYCLPSSEAGKETWYLSSYNGSYPEDNPLGGLAAGQAHTLLAEIITAKQYYAAHPTWFAAPSLDELKDGVPDSQRTRSKNQLCPYALFTDPAAYKIIKDYCQNLIDTKVDPNAPIQIISISKNDGPELCLCRKCVYDRIDHKDESGLYESIQYVQLLNKLSQDLRLKEDHPNVYLDMLAYEWTVEAPGDLTVDDHVIVRFAPIRRCYGHYLDEPNHITNTKYYGELVKWVSKCDNVWIWDYTAPFATTAGVYPNIDVLQHDIKLYKQLGVKGIYLQGNSEHIWSNSEFGDIRNYIAGRMLEDPQRDYERELEFITDALYGAAGAYVREYMKHLELQAANHHTIVDHRDDVFMYNTQLYKTFAGAYKWETARLNRMPDEEIGICEGIWQKIAEIAPSQPQDVQTRLNRLSFSWRLIKSTLNVYEFKNPATYKSANDTLRTDMQNAGITYFSLIAGAGIEKANNTQNHPDNWVSSSDDIIGRFTADTFIPNKEPDIPGVLYKIKKKEK